MAKNLKTLFLIGFSATLIADPMQNCVSFLDLAGQMAAHTDLYRFASNLREFPELTKPSAQEEAKTMLNRWLRDYESSTSKTRKQSLIRHRVQRYWITNVIKYLARPSDNPAILQSLYDLQSRQILYSGYARGTEQVCNMSSCLTNQDNPLVDYKGFANFKSLTLRGTLYATVAAVILCTQNLIHLFWLSVPLGWEWLDWVDDISNWEKKRLTSFFASVLQKVRKDKDGGRVYLQFTIPNYNKANERFVFNFLFEDSDEPEVAFFVSRE